jgi:hypothetical protein
MSYQYSGLFNFKYQNDTKTLPYLSSCNKPDVKTLKNLTKSDLLALCENDTYVFKLCNTTPVLYDIITSPN